MEKLFSKGAQNTEQDDAYSTKNYNIGISAGMHYHIEKMQEKRNVPVEELIQEAIQDFFWKPNEETKKALKKQREL